MTPQDRVAKLEALLDRIRRNGAKPRNVARVVAASATPPAAKPVSQPMAAPAPVQREAAHLPPAPPEPSPIPEPTPVWNAEPPSSVQPRPGSLAPEELSDDDLLEVSTIPPAEAAGPPEAAPEAPPEIVVSVSSEVELEEERPPSSSRRSKVAETLDEALASAAQMEQEEEREVPVKTPPPESGPQEAAAPLPGGLEAPGVPDVEGLEADMLGPPSMGPTAEQLGETIELEAPRGPELEIDVAADGALGGRPEAPPEELEVALPRAPMPSGTYDVPAEAAAEIIQPAEPQAPAVEAAPENLGPERTVRAQHGATDVARVVLAPSTAPKNFVELLDVSLGL